MSVYDHDTQIAASRLLQNEDFGRCITEHMNNLKEAVFDATKDEEALAARAEYNAIREFVEWLRMVQPRKKGDDT